MSASEVQLLLYDNHYDGSAPLKATDLLYRSANKLGVPFRAGSRSRAHADAHGQ